MNRVMNANPELTRRRFLKQSAALTTGIGLATAATCSHLTAAAHDHVYTISLAEWSLHRTIRDERKLDHLDFPIDTRRKYGLDAVEHVNQFFKDKAKDLNYLGELKKRCDGEGVRSLLIMIDGEGNLGDADRGRRLQAVENHYPWVEAAKFLGCHSIRVNAATGGVGSFEEQQNRAADGLERLSRFGKYHRLNVIVENHGGLSSNGAWLAGVMRKVNLENCGTLPDFGNFNLGGGREYDRYLGVQELMPFAKAVSAKSHNFDEAGQETRTDYLRMLKIVVGAGYHGYVGIEYEGNVLSEEDGIKATKKLLQHVRCELA